MKALAFPVPTHLEVATGNVRTGSGASASVKRNTESVEVGRFMDQAILDPWTRTRCRNIGVQEQATKI